MIDEASKGREWLNSVFSILKLTYYGAFLRRYTLMISLDNGSNCDIAHSHRENFVTVIRVCYVRTPHRLIFIDSRQKFSW